MANAKDVAKVVAAQTGVSLTEAEKQVRNSLNAIIEVTKEDGRTTFPGVGTFSAVTRKARTGRNPKTGEALEIPAKDTIKFKPSSK